MSQNSPSGREKRFLGSGSPSSKSQDYRTIWRDFGFGLAITLALMVGNYYLMQTPIGERFVLTGYDIVQGAMARVAGSSPPPTPRVAVVDLTGFPTQLAMTEHGPESAYDRGTMSKLLDVLTDPARRAPASAGLPVAIGIDNDFSPDIDSKEDTGAVTPDDTAFFQECQRLHSTTGVPIFLGIARSIKSKPENWLIGNKDPKDADYRDMAASLEVEKKDQQRLVLWTKFGSLPQCPSLSNRLSTTVLGREPQERKSFPFEQFRTDRLGETPEGKAQQGEGKAEGEAQQAKVPNEMRTYLVDYSQVNALIDSRIEYQELMRGDAKAQQDLASLAGCIVILGDADPADITSDSFMVTYGKRVPGVYLHASGVYSLLAPNPIHVLTHAGRVLVDFLLSATVFGSITLVSLMLLRRDKHLATERVQKPLSYSVAIITVAGGVALAPAMHLVWDDFLLVGAALLLHPHLHYLATNIHKTPALLRRETWEKALLEHEEEAGGTQNNHSGGSS